MRENYMKKLVLLIAIICSTSIQNLLADSLEYAKIAPHPRLLLNQQEEKNVRNAIKMIPQLERVHNQIISKSDEMLSLEDLAYNKQGKRLLAVSREAIRRVFYLSYSYRITKDKKYLAKAEAELNAVCAFENWNPTHYLDVGEMTMAVAIGYDWLNEQLQESTKENIRQAILKHTFETSQVHEYNRYKRVSNNWNQVCNAGLVYGALAIFESCPAKAKAIIEEALSTNPISMASYAPDGNYPEGAMYWNYGTSFEVMMLAALDSALGSDGGLSQSPGFLKSAEFMLYVNGPIGKRFNYSDCGGNQCFNIAQFWFAKKSNNANLLFEEKKLMDSGRFLKMMEEERLLPAVIIFANGIDFSAIAAPKQNVWSGNGETPVVLVRSNWNSGNSEYLGVKGGQAYTSHAHMDAGTFVYDSKGLRWAMDLGLQSYITLESKGIDLWNKEQDSPRWDIFRLNNRNHNTITINNKHHSVKGKATILEVYNSASAKGAMIDMSPVFAGEVSSAVRKVVLKDDVYLLVNDDIVTNNKGAEVRWTMVTPADAKIINGTTIELTQKGKKKRLQVSANFPFELKTWNSADPGTLYDAKNQGTLMIGFVATIPANEKGSFVVTLKD